MTGAIHERQTNTHTEREREREIERERERERDGQDAICWKEGGAEEEEEEADDSEERAQALRKELEVADYLLVSALHGVGSGS